MILIDIILNIHEFCDIDTRRKIEKSLNINQINYKIHYYSNIEKHIAEKHKQINNFKGYITSKNWNTEPIFIYYSSLIIYNLYTAKPSSCFRID
jgi:hypothetical protein